MLVTGIGPLGTDMYAAALPALAVSLSTSGAVAQLTLTAFIVGLAVGQLFVGPVSDATGRRRVLLTSSAVFAVTSVLCAVAGDAGILLALRLVQGTAAGAGVSVGRAVVSDDSTAEEAAVRLGTLASIAFLAPVLAPALGAGILLVGSWRTVFAVLGVVGAAMVAATALGIPETLPAERRQPPGLGAMLDRMRRMILDPTYARVVVVQCLATAGFFTYIAGSSFVLQTVYGVSQSGYAAIFAVNALGMVVASVVFRLLVGRVALGGLRMAGLLVSLGGAVVLLCVALLVPDVPHAVDLAWACFFVVARRHGPDHPGQHGGGPGRGPLGPRHGLGPARRAVLPGRGGRHAADGRRRLRHPAAARGADGAVLRARRRPRGRLPPLTGPRRGHASSGRPCGRTARTPPRGARPRRPATRARR